MYTNTPLLRLSVTVLLALACSTDELRAQAVTPVFTYQGELRTGGNPANASFDMEFRLFGAAAGGSQIGAVVTRSAVVVSGGLFSVPLDFGPAQFAGDRQWLEIRIKPAGSGSFETLSPRTEVTATPYALGAVNALANSVTGSSIVDGSVGTADINAAQVQRRVSGSCPAGQYLRVVNENGTVTCGTDANAGGTVTSIATGAGLTGGPITGSGTIAVSAGGIGTTQINPAQVQRRVTGSCPAGQYVRVINEAGTVTCGVDETGAAGWGLNGNAGTNPGANFIGTTDAQPFVVRTRSAQSLRIEPSQVLFESLPITANVIAGSSANSVTVGVRGATISGGGVLMSDPDFASAIPNVVTDHYGSIGGGFGNTAGNNNGSTSDSPFATVGGGFNNAARGVTSTVGGGVFNVANGESSAVGGGQENLAGIFATVGGGRQNAASGSASTIAGGESNVASGGFSAVGGGSKNCAGGNASWAGGFGAKVRPATNPGGSGACSGLTYPGGLGDLGTFVWADAQDGDFVSTGSNQFLVRAAGGMAINSNAPGGNALRVGGTLRLDLLGSAGVTTLCRNANQQIGSCSSSARYKQDIIDLELLGLDAVLRLRAVGYHWKDTGEADVGFVAEEIALIDERLATRNADGEIEGVKYDRLTAVLANAVQELAVRDSLANERVTAAGIEIAALRERLARIEAKLGAAD